MARYLECSPAKVSRMETGVVKVGVQDLRALLELYDVVGPARDELFARARESRRRGWWHEFADIVPPGSARFYGLEDAAVTIAHHSASLVPGLLQTRSYVAALIGSVPGIDLPLAGQRVALRMRRQQLLDRAVPPRLHVVLDEAVLCRRVGGPAVLAEQLRHLLAVAQRPTVTIQVVEFTAATHPAVGVSFTVFGLGGATDADQVDFRAQLDANSFVEHPAQVAIYTSALAE
ncbi:MAG: helix-turn-helix domain-containing protein, partial [Pseudonocardia sp.]